jgi:hypothetical protein
MLNRFLRRTFRLAFATLLPCAAAPYTIRAQAADLRCDSILTAAHVDSVPGALFISINRTDDFWTSDQQIQLLTTIGAAFVPPHPFRMAVFSGPSLSRSLRIRGADTASELRAPTITGDYRFTTDTAGNIGEIRVARASLMVGFDSAAIAAVREAGQVKELFKAPSRSMTLDLRLSTDSTLGARRLTSAFFPRVPVVDAQPLPDNPAPTFPDSDRAAGVTSGEVVTRFVVDRLGMPMTETIEFIRGSSLGFARQALTVFPKLRFKPATVHGCAVAQRIDYPFAFLLPVDSSQGPRH